MPAQPPTPCKMISKGSRLLTMVAHVRDAAADINAVSAEVVALANASAGNCPLVQIQGCIMCAEYETPMVNQYWDPILKLAASKAPTITQSHILRGDWWLLYCVEHLSLDHFLHCLDHHTTWKLELMLPCSACFLWCPSSSYTAVKARSGRCTFQEMKIPKVSDNVAERQASKH